MLPDGVRTIRFYPLIKSNGNLQTGESLPVVTSPSATDCTSQEQIVNNLMASPGSSKSKGRIGVNRGLAKSLVSPTNFNVLNPSADLKLPAEIFASDDSVSDAGLAAVEDNMTAQHVLQNSMLGSDLCESATKDKMLGGINLKLGKSAETSKTSTKKSKKAAKDTNVNLNLADIKTELQDDLDWNNMTLATVNNNSNVNRFQPR